MFKGVMRQQLCVILKWIKFGLIRQQSILQYLLSFMDPENRVIDKC